MVAGPSLKSLFGAEYAFPNIRVTFLCLAAKERGATQEISGSENLSTQSWASPSHQPPYFSKPDSVNILEFPKTQISSVIRFAKIVSRG